MSADAEIKRSATKFADTVVAGLNSLRSLLPPGEHPALATNFLEQQVRSLILEQVPPARLCYGTFGGRGVVHPETGPIPVEGMVHNGPAQFEHGRFAVLDPASCGGVITVKASAKNLAKFEADLRNIRLAYLRNRPAGQVMGVLVRDPDPLGKSLVRRNNRQFQAYDCTNAKWCPIFILFKYGEGKYAPHTPAIEAMLANLRRAFTVRA